MRTQPGRDCCSPMFGLFKKDPLISLQKRHAAALSEAHRLSTIDRSKSDALMVKAADLEEEIALLLEKKKDA